MEQVLFSKVVDFALENPAQTAQWGEKFALGEVQGFKHLFQGAFNVKDRNRSLQLTFVNATSKDVILQQNYFDSGTWVNSFPVIIPARRAVVGSVASKQGGFLVGVTGGLGMQIKDTNVYLALGFTNPEVGGYKNYAELRHESQNNGQYGYSKAEDNNPKLSELSKYVLQVRQVNSEVAQMGVLWTLNEKK